jgi:hypothetical protein
MVFIDKKGKLGWSHLISADIEELHEFAQQIGLKNEWFQAKPTKPHYDVKGMMRKRAIESGAIEVSSKEIVILLKKNFQENV